ncbi:MAG: HEAT repeat domain-containing protein [Sphingobacteriales bacterium]|nr:MAG: HEAT repeat domain-containing protein [Sphingobacteriales bacterium]
MNDPLKEFVEQNRAAFDELDAPPFDLQRFKARINPAPEQKIKKLWPGIKWLVAASVLIAVGTTFLLLRENTSPHSADRLVKKVKPQTPKTTNEKNIVEVNEASQVSIDRQVVGNSKKSIKKFKPLFSAKEDIFEKLSDSSSSSIRLAAILDIEKSGQISNDVIDRLAKTLNHDENSNVRLAALSVLEKYSFDTHVSSLLVRSLNTQNDPMVQLGLVTILGKMKDLNINDKLYALANDPNTFDAVKDEAYSILLKDDKL